MRDPSSPTRGPTCMPCIGRQILNLWATREVLEILSFPNKNCNLNAYTSCINILNKKIYNAARQDLYKLPVPRAMQGTPRNQIQVSSSVPSVYQGDPRSP